MTTILVPTDYSDTAKNATNYAIELAKQIKAKIILLHVYDLPVAASDFPIVVSSAEEIEKTNIALMKQHEEDLQAKYGNDIQLSGMVKMGFVFDEIKNAVEKEKISMIIMGITGAGRITELLMGSNATRVVKKIHCPSIIVPADAHYKPVKNIVFACDYNNIEESKAVDKLVEYVKLFEAKLMVLNIGKPHSRHSYSKELAGRLLEYIFENANENIDIPQGIDYSTHQRKDDDVVHGINRFIKKHNADLIVMIPREHHTLLELFHESNTKKMAFHTHVPVLTLHEEA